MKKLLLILSLTSISMSSYANDKIKCSSSYNSSWMGSYSVNTATGESLDQVKEKMIENCTKKHPMPPYEEWVDTLCVKAVADRTCVDFTKKIIKKTCTTKIANAWSAEFEEEETLKFVGEGNSSDDALSDAYSKCAAYKQRYGAQDGYTDGYNDGLTNWRVSFDCSDVIRNCK